MVHAYTNLREAMQLSAEEMVTFEERSLAVVRLRRPWHRPSYIKQRVHEACTQYHWRLTILDDLLDHMEDA